MFSNIFCASLEKHSVSSSGTHSIYFAKFYVFDVGQGNSQLIVYPELKIAFLYDAGSSSYRKHLKFLSDDKRMTDFLVEGSNVITAVNNQASMSSVEVPNAGGILGPKRERAGGSKEKAASNSSKVKAKQTKIEGLERKLSGNDSDNSSASNGKDDTLPMSVDMKIREILLEADITHLVVLLSHSDKDHISILSKSIIPQNIKTAIIACGDFLVENSEIQEFFAYCLSRENICISLPYTWDRETTPARIHSILNPPSIFQGNIMEFFEIVKERPVYRKEGSGISSLFFDTEWEQKIRLLQNKIFIWGLNTPSADPNTQSTVISFKLSPSTSVILTGDATPKTFQKIRVVAAAKVSEEMDNILGSNRILVVPHHGAKDNISLDMIDLFRPTLAIISAANGMHFHPHRNVYEWLMSYIDRPCFRVKEGEENSILCFGEHAALKDGNTGEFAKVVSTNFSGTLKLEDGFFSRTFSPTIEYAGKVYKADLRKRVLAESLKIGELYYVKGVESPLIVRYVAANRFVNVDTDNGAFVDINGFLLYSAEEIMLGNS
ncbi:MAG: hypothetical protein ACK4V2_06615 [Pseudomonadota bacterium]|jgi:beta-lactamase superfamily II metal-dependent hydrolase|nr:hypothetical protein [Alphaproteobacteria bacterium]